MANRDRTDPHRSAQAGIYRGADQSHGNQLNADGGKRGSDIGTTQPVREGEEDRDNDGRRSKRRKGRTTDA